jgi:lipopolysaccharide assembly outer membrane protein LptD (OstA)
MVKETPGQAPGQTRTPGQTSKAAPAAPAKAPQKPGATNASASSDANAEASKINRVDAQGHVVVVGAQDIGRGDYGVYNTESGICTLLGNVVITRGKDIITGQYAVMDMNRNISRILPASTLPGSTRQRVQGVFVKQDAPGGQGAADKTPKPAAPAAATPAKSP